MTTKPTNRVIKFRAWDFEKRFMVAPADALFMQIFRDHEIESMRIRLDYRNIFIHELEKKFVLMQFTGLIDKNGRDIYEGDIVREQDHFGEVHVKPVIYSRDAFVLSYTGRDSMNMPIDAIAEQRIGSSKLIEVIGNIYENSGLIKQIKQMSAKSDFDEGEKKS